MKNRFMKGIACLVAVAMALLMVPIAPGVQQASAQDASAAAQQPAQGAQAASDEADAPSAAAETSTPPTSKIQPWQQMMKMRMQTKATTRQQ